MLLYCMCTQADYVCMGCVAVNQSHATEGRSVRVLSTGEEDTGQLFMEHLFLFCVLRFAFCVLWCVKASYTEDV